LVVELSQRWQVLDSSDCQNKVREMTYMQEWYLKNKSYALNFKRIDRVMRPEHYKKLDHDNHMRHQKERNEYSLKYYYKNRERILAKIAARNQNLRNDSA
jgi:hypothetical protein